MLVYKSLDFFEESAKDIKDKTLNFIFLYTLLPSRKSLVFAQKFSLKVPNHKCLSLIATYKGVIL